MFEKVVYIPSRLILGLGVSSLSETEKKNILSWNNEMHFLYITETRINERGKWIVAHM